MTTLDGFMPDTGRKQKSGPTPQKSTPKNSRTLTACAQDSLVRLSRLRANGSALKSLEARYFMKSLGLQNKNDLAYYSLKTLRDSCQQDLPQAQATIKQLKETEREKLQTICSESKTNPDEALRKFQSTFKKANASCRFYVRWMKSGMMSNGKVSTANILYRKTGPGYFLSDILEANPDPKYFLSDKQVESILLHADYNREKGNGFGAVLLDPKTDKLAHTVIAKITSDRSQFIMESKLEKVVDGSQRATVYDSEGLAPTITAGTHGYALGYIAEPKLKKLVDGREGERVYDPAGISSTVKAGGGGHGGKSGLYLIKPGIYKDRTIRRLTPLECERLQSFPDFWTDGLKDGQRYKCIGNAVTASVIEFIGRMLK